MADIKEMKTEVDKSQNAAPTFRDRLVEHILKADHRLRILKRALELVDNYPVIVEYDELMATLQNS